MKKNGLTISLIFEAQSANYGEGFSNLAILKKISRQGGNMYSYISRQALRYNMIQQLGWDNTPAEAQGSGDKKVVQFKPDATIKDYPEIDLFGYMKTEKGDSAKTRSAVVRLSNAVALEAYSSDMDYLNNMALAKRANQPNALAQSEIQKSFYAYTITIDLDRIGVDDSDGITISETEKAKRVVDLLKTVETLYRDIRGRRENLAPVFIVGGLYERKNAFFENRLTLNKMELDVKKVKATMEGIESDTIVGYLEGSFNNGNEIENILKPCSIYQAFEKLAKEVEAYYNARA